jgi:dihydropteroate synthase
VTRLLHCGRYRLDLRAPCVMGVINVTPDSFSDGGELFGPRGLDLGAVRARAEQMCADGAALLDVGGESTRPGAATVAAADEMSRVLPVVEALVPLDVPISVDTSNPDLMRAAIAAGASMINDVRGLSRPGALAAVAATDVGLCVMHMQGEPGTMQQAPQYDDVVTAVHGYLRHRVDACLAAGIAPARLLVDPGFGFGKTPAHNLRLLAHLEAFADLGVPLLVGLSRKGTIGVVTGQTDARLRMAGSIAAAVLAAERGARVIRAHDVRETVDALRVLAAVREATREAG